MFGQWGNHDHDDSIAIIRSAVERGINFVDTANVYSGGESEEIVGKALKPIRDEVFLATKVHFPVGGGKNDRGNSRLHIMRSVEDSLRRLDTDHIDLYQIHRPDPDTDVAETLSALTDLVRQGKVRYIGSSTFPGAEIVEAQWMAEKWGLQRFVCEQPPYSIVARQAEREVFPATMKHRMATIVWSPLAGGWLSGKYRKGEQMPKTGRASRIPLRFDPALPENQRKYDVVEQLIPLAEAEGISMVKMAIAWSLAHPAVTSSIIGPRTMEQLDGQIDADELQLSDKVMDAIDEIVKPGITLNPADNGYEPRWLEDKGLRRR